MIMTPKIRLITV